MKNRPSAKHVVRNQLQARTNGYLSKNCYLAADGSGLFSQEAWYKISINLRLSPREFQIAQGIFNDQKEAAIADELGISAHTVHAEHERLRQKLNVHDRVSLVLRIVREYLSLLENQTQEHFSACVHYSDNCPTNCPFADTEQV